MKPLAMVVAMTADRVIGKDGGMPWHIPEDLKHFRRVTMGHAIIMGRKTHESIGRALPRRRNIVITRQRDAAFEGCDVAHSIEDAIAMARAGGDDEPRIVGGGVIYELALPLATKLYVSEVALDVDGDTHFPPFDPEQWTETERRAGEGVVYRTLELK
ncbi:MAG: dihydrofolate reductase [Myxococcota bacterium]|nr:dihydrofolate reductase [Myxococcota bacterium]